MRAVGYALLLAVLVVGGGWVCNLLSEMSREQCRKECPQNSAALKQRFSIGPFELVTCNCGEVER